MRTIHWVCAGFIALIAVILMAFQASTTAQKKISYDELAKLLQHPQSVLFIDVREPNEIAVTGTLKGALTIPLGQLESRLKEVPKDKPIAPFCKAGGRAAHAAAILSQHGYRTVGVFGLDDYHEKVKDYIVYPK
jgi:rhodanese-related sulfurtransferase